MWPSRARRSATGARTRAWCRQRGAAAGRDVVSEIRLTAAWVARATGGTIVRGDAGQEFSGVSIDTRTLRAGELFVAIRGERFDGADFADAAIAGGAAGVLVGRSTGSRSAGSVIAVDDTIAALQSLAHAVRVES